MMISAIAPLVGVQATPAKQENNQISRVTIKQLPTYYKEKQ
jgi:hypothetical protein